MKLILILSLLFLSICANAKSYYISEKGNNSNDGLTTSTPWQTIGKVNSFSFAANDSILFKRGDIFYGAIIVSRSNLNFGAYGTGAKPIISGLSTVTGWVNLGGNIWEAPVTNVKADVNLVLRNGAIQQVGRYPNANAANGGYLTLTASTGGSVGSTCTITGPAVSSTTNWTGAEMVLRIQRWMNQHSIVTAHSGGVVSYIQPAGNAYTAVAGFGYFFQRDPRTLDLDGEWWYDKTNGKLRMYFASNNPALNVTQISTIDTLIYSANRSSVTINNLSFTGADKEAIWLQSGTSVSVNGCDFNNSGQTAITGWFSSSVSVNNCSIKNSLNSGVVLRNSGSSVNYAQLVTNCNVDSTGMFAGMAGDGDDVQVGRAGITVFGNGSKALNNVVSNSGYIGIEFQGNDVNIKYNYIHHFLQNLDDGGGIYTFEKFGSSGLPPRSNRNIVSNILLYAKGNNYGTSTTSNLTSARGIYLDMNSYHVTIDSNTIAYCNGSAIYPNSTKYLTATNNTCYQNYTGYTINKFENDSSVRNIVIKKNIFYPFRFQYTNLAINQPALVTKEADILAMGMLDSNYYSLRSGIDTSFFSVTTYAARTNYAQSAQPFSYLTGTIGIEKHSINVANTGVLFYNATGSPITTDLGGYNYIDVYGINYPGTITLQPYTSAILIKSGVIDAGLKADAGTDISLVLPTNTTILKGSANGTIVTYNWTKIAGPNQFTIANPANPSTAINNLASGKYTFQLKVINSAGDSAFATTNVVVLGVLPVTLINFAAKNINDKVELDWLVASEINVSHYSIERSGNGLDFENIGQVNANNLFNVQTNYKYNDSFPAQGTNYYRLAMIDNDGTTKYSRIISADVKNASASKLENLSLSISNTNIKIGITSNSQQVMHLVVADVSGRILFTNPIQLQKGFNAINKKIPALNTGIYYAKLFTRDQLITRAILSGR